MRSDDDTNGPIFFIRALEDGKNGYDITAQDVGDALLNYACYEQGFFWWGGYGNSTEHTAYLNQRAGIPAPRSGSIEQNGATIAEQIGGQIFIDTWGLVCPGNPDLAAKYAEKAASVTHGGNGIYGGVSCFTLAGFIAADCVLIHVQIQRQFQLRNIFHFTQFFKTYGPTSFPDRLFFVRLYIVRPSEKVVGRCLIKVCQLDKNTRRNVVFSGFIAADCILIHVQIQSRLDHADSAVGHHLSRVDDGGGLLPLEHSGSDFRYKCMNFVSVGKRKEKISCRKVRHFPVPVRLYK